MSFLTRLALSRRPVTVLIMILVLVGGILTYRSLPVELFPDIEFPLVTVLTFYPSASSETVVQDVTQPIENAISSLDGLEDIQSTSLENRSVVLANFTFGTDMDEAERIITSNLNNIVFPSGVNAPRVGRINTDSFPAILLSVLGDRDIPELQRIVQTLILPAIESVDGVFGVDVTGGADRQVLIDLDTDKLSETGISVFQVMSALRENNVTLPAGAITEEGQTLTIRISNTFSSLDQILNLTVGVSSQGRPPGAPSARGSGSQPPPEQVLLSDIAEVSLGASAASSISRTNGKASIGIGVLKEPDANTVDVTSEVLENLSSLPDLPPDVEIVTITNDGPEIQAQVDSLQREALLGFLFAVVVVFAFLINVRPGLLKGLTLTLRPTLVVGMSIPLSILSGILLMGAFGLNLNLMTLGGLAISVGRVVDDSIVVLENVYRHLQRSDNRIQVALEATKEVAPAIITSTLTTIVVFLPLAFIQGLVGSFFLPFAITVSFTLIASLVVALTAIPVLAAILLRPGDLNDDTATDEGAGGDETWMQKAYTPALLWTLRHKIATILGSLAITIGSLALVLIIPITLFPSGGERFLTINITVPPDTSLQRTIAQVEQVEDVLAGLTSDGIVDLYQSTIGSTDAFAPGGGSPGSGIVNIFLRLSEDAPDDVAETLRAQFDDNSEQSITVTEIDAGGPPTSGLEVSIAGSDYAVISDVARRLVDEFSSIDGIVNVSSDVTEARDELLIAVNPEAAAVLGLTTRAVALQVNQLLVGQQVTQVVLEGVTTSVVLRARPDDLNSVDKLKAVTVTGPLGSAPLADIAEVSLQKGPVSISRSDGQRAASINGSITGENTQAIGREVQAKIDAIGLPPGIDVTTGGIFQQVAEGFQDIGLAMAVGIILVYLVMVASLGSLRNPFVIIMSLPLALIGALAALVITSRTLGLPAMMGVLLLIGIVITNAIVLIAFVEQLRERGLSVHDALVEGGRTRLRPILMTAFTTSIALLPLAAFVSAEGGIIGAELATVVIGGLMSSTFLTLIVVPVVYTIMHENLPHFFRRIGFKLHLTASPGLPASAAQEAGDN